MDLEEKTEPGRRAKLSFSAGLLHRAIDLPDTVRVVGIRAEADPMRLDVIIEGDGIPAQPAYYVPPPGVAPDNAVLAYTGDVSAPLVSHCCLTGKCVKVGDDPEAEANGTPAGFAELPDLLAGVYRHWKGPLYLVLGYGGDANDDRRKLVVYVGLELTETARPGPRFRVRDVGDFFAWVQPDDEKPDRVRRFSYVGPEWDGRRP